ncbi:MAG: AmmeMemoRadiSam system protein A [Planctomycetales bacterium]
MNSESNMNSENPVNMALSASQQESVLRATAEIVLAAATGKQPALADASLAGAAKQRVAGAFVSLKRGRCLRSCCGLFNGPVTLSDALHRAARRSVLDDPRFPRVSPGELPWLNMEVWLLASPRPIKSHGVSRVREVVIGKHGLIITLGSSSGLLLPSVPVDHHWNAAKFLEQVSVKAGLPRDAWLRDDAKLQLFEGDVLRGPAVSVAQRKSPDAIPSLPPPLNADQFQACLAFGRATLRGDSVPVSPILAENDEASGVVVSVLAGGERRHFAEFSWKRPAPLRATLPRLLTSAAEELQKTGSVVPPENVDLMVFHDAQLLGFASEPDLQGVNPREQAIAVVARDQLGWAFDSARTPEEVLHAARDAAGSANSLAGTVYRYAATVSDPAISFARSQAL